MGGSHTIRFGRHFKVTGTTTLYDVLAIDGGTFTTDSLVNPHLLQFNSGTLNLTGDDLTIGPGGALGDHLVLPWGKNVSVTNNTTVEPSGRLTVLNGTFSSATVTNDGEIRLDGAASELTSGSLENNGLVAGDGMIAAPLINSAAGRVSVASGERLTIDSTGNSSDGQIELVDGLLKFTGDLTNNATGRIGGHGGLVFDGGMTNHGEMNFGADTEVYGDVVNGQTGAMGTDGEVVVSGGASVSFHGDVVHNGVKFKISPNADVVFFGNLSGDGSFTGGGSMWIEGTFSPGNSPAWVQEEANLTFGDGSDSTMELAGHNADGPGDADYDVIEMLGGHALVLDGTLNIDLLEGFEPALGSTFDIYRYDSGNRMGEFDSVNSPIWGDGQYFNISYGNTLTTLTVVPEPSTFILAAIGLLGLAAYFWRRRRSC